MESLLVVLITLSFDGVISQWDNWNWNNNNHNNMAVNIPNNNVAIGYPTAYGLYAGKGNGNNNNWNYNGGGGLPNAGTGFGSPLRCLNGGAHIGQCRLDNDSICIALGGTCTHGSCCTTPFVSINGGITTKTPEMIDGETTKRKPKVNGRKVTTTEATTTVVQPTEDENSEEESDIIDSKEMEEWNRLIERARTTTPTTPTTTEMLTVEPFVEDNENRKCSSGLRSVGPCSEDSDCPTLHQCENQQCCYLVI